VVNDVMRIRSVFHNSSYSKINTYWKLHWSQTIYLVSVADGVLILLSKTFGKGKGFSSANGTPLTV